MCGLAGFLTSDRPERGTLVKIASSMADTLTHRGPDDSGVWVDPACGVALGFRRLSIIDLVTGWPSADALGQRPLCDRIQWRNL